MTIKKIYSLIAMFAFSMFVFTACEDPAGPEPTPTTSIPKAVATLEAGATSETTIRFQWRHSESVNETWFKEYRVAVTKEGTTKIDTFKVEKTKNAYDVTVSAEETGKIVTLSVWGVSDAGKVSTTVTHSWAASKFFTKTAGDIKVYGSSATYGSGLELFGEDKEPTIHKVANGAKWNLGLYAKGTTIVFGTASKLGYTNLTGTPADAEITDVMADDDQLGNLLLEKDLSKYTFSKKTIDLAKSTNSKGVVFFARTGSGATANYAKVVIIKKGNSFLQGTGDNVYVQVYISYQTAAGVPYAKIFAGK